LRIQRLAGNRAVLEVMRLATAVPQRPVPASLIQRMIHKGHKRGRRVVVDKKDDANLGKEGILLGPYDKGYRVQIPGIGVVTYDFFDLKLAAPGTRIAGLLESEMPGPLDSSLSAAPDDKEAARQPPWSVAEAKALASLAASIVQRHPPAEHVYIPIGNSPALVMEFIRQELGDSGGQPPVILPVPISTVSAESYVEHRDDDQRQARMMRYLTRYLPRDAFTKRRAVVIDYSSGQSLRIMALHIGRYLGHAPAVVNLRSGPAIGALENLGNIETSLQDTRFEQNLTAFHKEAETLGPLPSIDPESTASAFLTGIAVKEEGQLRWKEGFGYKLWKDASYDDVLGGRLEEAQPDEGARDRVVRAIAFVRAALSRID
jgi:hypothetical protein